MANYTYGVSLLIANVAIAISAVGYGTELFGATLSPVQIGGHHRRAVDLHRG